MKKMICLLALAITTFSLAQGLEPSKQNLPIFCGDSKGIMKHISDKYKEELIAHGSINETSVMTLWASKNLRTWTVLYISGDVACLIGSGTKLKVKDELYI